MRKAILVFAVLVFMAGNAQAAVKEIISITSGAAVAITSTTYAPTAGARADECVCTLETAPIRFWIDGSTPTASEGHLLNAGDSVTLNKEHVTDFLGIAVSTTASLSCTCYLR